MSRLASIIAKVGVDTDDIVELMEYVKKHGSERAGIAAYLKDADDIMKDINFQLKAQGYEVNEESNTDKKRDERPRNVWEYTPTSVKSVLGGTPVEGQQT